MKKIKVYLLDLYGNFEREDLILAILLRIANCTLVNKIELADIVIRGVHRSPVSFVRLRRLSLIFSKLNFKDVGKFDENLKNIREVSDPHKKQIWIHLSGESPNNSSIGSFFNSECDYGIGHETLILPNYIRMPNWYQSIDWSSRGFPRPLSAFYRLGEPIHLNELLVGRASSSINNKEERCALIASHLTSPRDVFVAEIQKILPVDIYGMSGSCQIQYKANFPKRKLLEKYAYVLAPENKLHPGYITEKIPEAFVCGAFPIGWYLPSIDGDFTKYSHVNTNDLGAAAISCNGILSEWLTEKFKNVKNNGIPPLLDKPPDLSSVVDMLEKVIKQVK